VAGAQIDYLTNRLDCTDEHVKSTEEQLTMELDHRRNELVAFDLFMTGVATVRPSFGVQLTPVFSHRACELTVRYSPCSMPGLQDMWQTANSQQLLCTKFIAR